MIFQCSFLFFLLGLDNLWNSKICTSTQLDCVWGSPEDEPGFSENGDQRRGLFSRRLDCAGQWVMQNRNIWNLFSAVRFLFDTLFHLCHVICSASKENLYLSLTVLECLDQALWVSLCMVPFLITITSFVRWSLCFKYVFSKLVSPNILLTCVLLKHLFLFCRNYFLFKIGGWFLPK